MNVLGVGEGILLVKGIVSKLVIHKPVREKTYISKIRMAVYRNNKGQVKIWVWIQNSRIKRKGKNKL